MVLVPPLILLLLGLFLFVVGIIKLGWLMLWPTGISLLLLFPVIQQERHKARQLAATSEGMGGVVLMAAKILAVQCVFCGWTAYLIWSHCPHGICS